VHYNAVTPICQLVYEFFMKKLARKDALLCIPNASSGDSDTRFSIRQSQEIAGFQETEIDFNRMHRISQDLQDSF
jgi:hypothetical protein